MTYCSIEEETNSVLVKGLNHQRKHRQIKQEMNHALEKGMEKESVVQ